MRKLNCPAYGKKCTSCDGSGHFSSVCRKKSQVTHAHLGEDSDYSDAEEAAIFLGAISSYAENDHTCSINACNSMAPLHHMEHSGSKGWESSKPKSDPTLKICVKLCPEAYVANKIICPSTNKCAQVTAIADSGARTTVASTSLLSDLGLDVQDLFPVRQKLCGANESPLEILGGIFLNISGNKIASKSARVMCYVQKDNFGKLYLSRKACEDLGIITQNFPMIQTCEEASPVLATDIKNDKECKCPKRENPPPIPTELPFQPTETNRKNLEAWLLQYYGSSTFNVCEHQPLPMMSGPPLKLFVDPTAKPHARSSTLAERS